MFGLNRYTCACVLALSMGCSSEAPVEEAVSGQQQLVAANGFWRFNDCSANTTTLASTAGVGLTATRGSGVTCGVRPNGASTVTVDAAGEEVAVPASSALQFSRNFAIAAWVNPSQVDSGKVHTIFHQGAANDDIVSFRIGHGRLELVLKVRTPGGSGAQVISEKVWTQTMAPGWSHVAGTWDGQRIRLYINGVKVRENRWFSTSTDILGSATTPIKIGSAPTNFLGSRQFFGSIDDVWVSGQATTDADISELFALPSCVADVSEPKELMITNLGVVEDPVRTTANGVWTFQHLMEAMAPSPAEAPEMVRQMFNTWLTDQTVNGQTVPARTRLESLVLTPWLNGGTTLDLSRAPLRLLAVVNRLDLRNLGDGKAGEGRFVFGILDEAGNATSFTMILEYRLPASSEADVLSWANLWHELGTLDLGSPAYNAKLEQITERFAGRNAEPGGVNGSALSQLRTNEIALSSPWELREFVLSTSTGLLEPATVKLTPDSRFMGEAQVAQFINQNEAAILAETHSVPDAIDGVPFLGGSSLNTLSAWNAPGINSGEARHKFSLNTCNGCHGTAETGTFFLQINPRSLGQEATLAGFLTGTDVTDPIDTTTVRHFDDLERRATDMERLLCAVPAGSSARARASVASTPGTSFIAQGIHRVH